MHYCTVDSDLEVKRLAHELIRVLYKLVLAQRCPLFTAWNQRDRQRGFFTAFVIRDS